MDSESTPLSEPQPSQESQVSYPAVSQPKNQLIAPVWHTIVIVGFLLLNSYGGRPSQHLIAVNARERLFLYALTFVVQLAVVLFIWFGISRKGLKMRELIGGRWAKPIDFLIDVGVAALFWLVSTILRGAISIALGLIDIHNPQGQLNEMKQSVAVIVPRSGLELTLFILLVIFAGIFEEIIFRGYLQRQLGALARNIWVGIILSGILFGAGHGYQGARQMVVIGIWGVMFGVLVVLRKSLRPGMITHAGQDAFSGIVYFFMFRSS